MNLQAQIQTIDFSLKFRRSIPRIEFLMSATIHFNGCLLLPL
jgi:hypothetical protein